MPVLLRAGVACGAGTARSLGIVGHSEVEPARIARARASRAGAIGQARACSRLHVERDRSVPGDGAADAAYAWRVGAVRAPAAAPRPVADAQSHDRTRPRPADA